jgi:GDP-4-dehydro-6-deoxy-D-mannose reductase
LQYGIPGDIVNIATGQPHSMRFYLDSLRQEASVATEVERDPARLRAADIACSSGDATYLTQLTGWTPRYSTQATLRDMLAYWRQKVSAER